MRFGIVLFISALVGCSSEDPIPIAHLPRKSDADRILALNQIEYGDTVAMILAKAGAPDESKIWMSHAGFFPEKEYQLNDLARVVYKVFTITPPLYVVSSETLC